MTTLIIAGDLSPQGRLATLATMSPSEVFGAFHQVLRQADLAIVNLESPLCNPTSAVVKTGPSLYGSPSTASFIASSGFKLACLANNHIMDYGEEGLSETFEALKNHDIAWVGAGSDYDSAARPYVGDHGGIRVGILNVAENEWSTTRGSYPGANPIDPVRNHRAIVELRSKVDRLVVICHGGHEMHALPSPRMKELFRFLVDLGADAVINHHTHCVSGYEVYKGAPIFYSIGNFLFDSESRRSGPWTQGMAVQLDLDRAHVGFKLHHFDQCTDTELFRLMSGEDAVGREAYLSGLSSVVADDEALGGAFRNMTSDRQRAYRSYLEPKLSRVISLAQRRGLLPSLISKRHRALLLNLIRCESHRDVLTELLKRDVGNP